MYLNQTKLAILQFGPYLLISMVVFIPEEVHHTEKAAKNMNISITHTSSSHLPEALIQAFFKYKEEELFTLWSNLNQTKLGVHQFGPFI